MDDLLALDEEIRYFEAKIAACFKSPPRATESAREILRLLNEARAEYAEQLR